MSGMEAPWTRALSISNPLLISYRTVQLRVRHTPKPSPMKLAFPMPAGHRHRISLSQISAPSLSVTLHSYSHSQRFNSRIPSTLCKYLEPTQPHPVLLQYRRSPGCLRCLLRQRLDSRQIPILACELGYRLLRGRLWNASSLVSLIRCFSGGLTWQHLNRPRQQIPRVLDLSVSKPPGIAVLARSGFPTIYIEKQGPKRSTTGLFVKSTCSHIDRHPQRPKITHE